MNTTALTNSAGRDSNKITVKWLLDKIDSIRTYNFAESDSPYNIVFERVGAPRIKV